MFAAGRKPPPNTFAKSELSLTPDERDKCPIAEPRKSGGQCRFANEDISDCNCAGTKSLLMSARTVPLEIFPADSGDLEPRRQATRFRSARRQRRIVRKIESVIAHMVEHVNGPVRISTLRRITALSESHFFTLFRSVTGYAPMEFFIRLRMQRACELFRGQDLSVKEAAAVLGYEDPFYFSRIFKLVIGIAPSDYRKRLRNSPVEEAGRARNVSQRNGVGPWGSSPPSRFSFPEEFKHPGPLHPNSRLARAHLSGARGGTARL
jgi:AraC-like DNA-binding protein